MSCVRLIAVPGIGIFPAPAIVGQVLTLNALAQNPWNGTCARSGSIQFAWSLTQHFRDAIPIDTQPIHELGTQSPFVQPTNFGVSVGSWTPGPPFVSGSSLTDGTMWASVFSPGQDDCDSSECGPDPIDRSPDDMTYRTVTGLRIQPAPGAIARAQRYDSSRYYAFRASGKGAASRLTISAARGPKDHSFAMPEVAVCVAKPVGLVLEEGHYYSGPVLPDVHFEIDRPFKDQIELPPQPVVQAVARVDWEKVGANKRCLLEIIEERVDAYGRRIRSGFNVGLQHIPESEDKVWLLCPR